MAEWLKFIEDENRNFDESRLDELVDDGRQFDEVGRPQFADINRVYSGETQLDDEAIRLQKRVEIVTNTIGSMKGYEGKREAYQKRAKEIISKLGVDGPHSELGIAVSLVYWSLKPKGEDRELLKKVIALLPGQQPEYVDMVRYVLLTQKL